MDSHLNSFQIKAIIEIQQLLYLVFRNRYFGHFTSIYRNLHNILLEIYLNPYFINFINLIIN